MPEGLHVSHFSVLNHMIRLGEGKTPLALASAFQVTKGTMTNTLNVLSRHGFIDIRPNTTDGRSKLVFLTEAGRNFHRRAIESLNPVMHALEGELDFTAMHDMLPELRRIRELLDNNRDL